MSWRGGTPALVGTEFNSLQRVSETGEIAHLSLSSLQLKGKDLFQGMAECEWGCIYYSLWYLKTFKPFSRSQGFGRIPRRSPFATNAWLLWRFIHFPHIHCL